MDDAVVEAGNRMTAVELIEEIHRLMQLKGENPFKVRAFENALGTLAGRDDLEKRAKSGTLTELPGIGKGISEVLTEFFLKGKSTALEELRASLPAGLVELTQIPGLGPKKAMTLIEDLGIHSVAELEYACRENRLLKLKGFGEKIQHKILEGIQFQKANQGLRRIDEALSAEERILPLLKKAAGEFRVSETGELRRKLEVVAKLDFLVEDGADKKKLSAAVEKETLPIELHFTKSENFGYELARTTASEAHWTAIGSPKPFAARDEETFYKHLHLEWISPELRETGGEVELAQSGRLNTLLSWDGVKGVFHNHTTRSDGTASLEEMVIEAKAQGYQYIGISDHSQSAFYASGLKSDALEDQEKEVRKVQEKHPEIRIFWALKATFWPTALSITRLPC